MFDAEAMQPQIPLQQSTAFLRAVRIMGGQAEKLPLGDEGRDGHALMQLRRLPVIGTVGLVSRGPYWQSAPDAEGFAQTIATKRHPVLVNADHAAGFASAGLINVMTPASVALLALGPDIEASMHQKWRNRLRKAEASSLNVVRTVFPADPLHWLLKAEAAQRRTRGYRGLHPAFAVAFAKANAKMAHFFVANLRNDPVAGMLFLRHGDMVTYHMGHTTNAGRALNAHTLLLARAARWFAGKGVHTIDLGSVDTVNAPGLARFKLGSGAKVKKLGGTWLFSPRLVATARFAQVQVPSAAARMARMLSP